MNLLLFSDLAAGMAAPRLAVEQLECGPYCEDLELGDRIFRLRTPSGNFSALSVLNRLPAHQSPDAVAVIVSGGGVWPRDLNAVAAPRILLLARIPSSPAFASELREYIASEPFDRVVAVSDRRAAVWLAELKPAAAAWLPGLLLPHSDAEVALARNSHREPRIAVCVQPLADEGPVLRLGAHLARQGLPVYARALPEAEVLAPFGSSLLALADFREPRLGLRALQAAAAGTCLLRPKAQPASGWDAFYPPDAALIFDSPRQLEQLARRALAQPEETAARSARAARWFDETFSLRRRQEALATLVLDGRVPDAFSLPVPEASISLPPLPSTPVFAEDADGNRALGTLEAGNSAAALDIARAAIKANDRSRGALLALTELALQGGKADLWAKMVARTRSVLGEDAQLARLELGSPGFVAECRAADAWTRAWNACGNRECGRAGELAQQALHFDPDCAEAYRVAAAAGLRWVRAERQWRQHGPMLGLLRHAAESSAGRPELWQEAGIARRAAGGVLAEAVPAYQAALKLDPRRLDTLFALGEALLALGRDEEALEAFSRAAALAPSSRGISLWLGHALKRAGRLAEAEVCHRRAFSDPAALPWRERSAGDRRRVVFVAQNGHGWTNWESVYAAFRRDPAWEVVVVGLPWLHPSFAASSYKHQEAVFDFLTERQIPFVAWTDYPLAEREADIVFLQNPYDSTRPAGWGVPELVAAGHRLCYIPYGIEIGADAEGLEYQFDMKLHRFAWAIFARSEAHRRLFARHCLTGHRHVVATGHPKFDDLGRQDGVAADPEVLKFARGRPVVLWNPHFDAHLDGTRCGRGFSTFLRWKDVLLEEISRREDLAFVIRPHPNFLSSMEERGLFTRAELEAYERRCAEAGVLWHRSPAYFPLLAAADAVISDGSSLLVEFGITGKPVAYLHNPDGPMAHLAYEIDFDFVRRHCRWILEESELAEFLGGLPSALADTAARGARASELRQRMGVRPDGTIGGAIKSEIERLTIGSESRAEGAPETGRREASPRLPAHASAG